MTSNSELTVAPTVGTKQDSVMGVLAPDWKQLQTSTSPASLSRPRRRRAAVYMRYSTDEQDPYSFERQRMVAEPYAQQVEADIVKIYADAGKSGAFTANRPAFQEMLEDAEKHEFEVLIVEEGDRLSRKLSIMANAYSKLADLGIELHSTKYGRWSLMHCAFAGLMSEDQKNRIFELLRSGRVKILARGLWPGTAPYAFEKIAGKKGDMRVVPEKAEVVRRMCAMALAGVGPDRIAGILQREGVPAPHGELWHATTVLYILRNPIYVGAVIFFRTKRTKIQEGEHEIVTKITERPAAEWMYAERPDWAILDLKTWQAVQALTLQQAKGPGPAYLLSRLVYCGECGKKMAFGNLGYGGAQYLQCTAQRVARVRKQTSSCNARCVRADLLQEGVVNLVARTLRTPNALKLMQSGYEGKASQKSRSFERDRVNLQKDRARIVAHLDQTYDDAMNAGMTTKAVLERRQSLCMRMDKIDDELAKIPIVRVAASPALPVPADIEVFIDDLRLNRNYRNCGAAHAKVLAIFQSLVEKIIVRTDWDHRTVHVQIEGPIAFVEESGEARLSLPTRWRQRMKEKTAAAATQVRTNILTDADWNKLKPRLHDEPIWVEGFVQPIELRSVLNAMIFQKRVGIGRLSLPEIFGPTKQVWAAAQKLSHGGIVDIIQPIMREEHIAIAKEIDISFDNLRTPGPRTWERYLQLNRARKTRILNRANERAALSSRPLSFVGAE
ncbi:recombinase family protein [Bradyrhizobium sp. CB1015]|uniref:recombinase family protein n=1 Tax=Bradyrhizobium sp. CB1015 TaxID=2976822 RepID=UPI0021AA11EC|nr:recombinase family protein [Bradyrhizobium sp. CB1015]UWU94393.1 recombinase family protein [Bradyrhizobium sp. CB1015]